MKNCSNNSKLTRQAAQAITDANIIEPWELRIQRAGENDAHEIKGLYKVNENALHELSDDDYIVLRKTGALILIYAHLFSLHQIAYLARRAEYLNKQSIAKIPIDMENLFEEGGNISFDTLNDN